MNVNWPWQTTIVTEFVALGVSDTFITFQTFFQTIVYQYDILSKLCRSFYWTKHTIPFNYIL